MNPDDIKASSKQLTTNSSQGTNVPADDDAAADEQNNSQQPAADKQFTASIPVPDEAADSDLIEKEWVERAKQIVEHTKDDPHEQQRAISQMRADYMKKRYNKDVGASEA